jgi:hypothetical protein
MTDEVNEIIASLNINKVLISILQEIGEVRVPTLTFLEGVNDKQLVIEYDEDTPSFIFYFYKIDSSTKTST